MNNNNHLKDAIDIAAGSTVGMTLLGFLPEIAAGMAIIWTCIRIYEWARVRIFKKEGKVPS